jgi:nucleoid-associated protein EbfC
MPDSTTPDMQTLLQQVITLREGLMSASAEMTSAELIGQSGGGLVTVTAKGTGEVVAIRLDPAVVGQDLPQLEELILTAITNAQEAARALSQQLTQPILPDFRGMR